MSSCPQEYVSFYMQKVFGSEMECQKNFDWLEKKSLDIYIKTDALNFAIEYDGKFSHQGKEDDDKNKNKKCRENGVEIIRIRELNPDENKSRATNTVSYYFKNDYNNIGDAIKDLCLLINNKYDLSIEVDIDIKRDKEEIIAYIQDKYYKKTVAYKWPEAEEYWYGKEDSIFNIFHTSIKKYKLRCPHCGKIYNFEMRYLNKQKSIKPCECEKKQIQKNVDKLINNYKISKEIIFLDNSLHSRRMYDNIKSRIRYDILSDEEKEMYRAMGFELPQKEDEEEVE